MRLVPFYSLDIKKYFIFSKKYIFSTKIYIFQKNIFQCFEKNTEHSKTCLYIFLWVYKKYSLFSPCTCSKNILQYMLRVCCAIRFFFKNRTIILHSSNVVFHQFILYSNTIFVFLFLHFLYFTNIFPFFIGIFSAPFFLQCIYGCCKKSCICNIG